MMIISLIYLLSLLQTEIPLKANAEFEVKLDYQFKQRPQTGTDGYSANGTKITQNGSGGVLPYLIVNFKVLKHGVDEVKIRISSNTTENIFARKTSDDVVIPIDFGFMEDIKDRVTAHAYTILFLSAKKEVVSKILIDIDEEGNFFVNSEKRGKL